MPRFRYSAIDAQGKPFHGTLDAENVAALAERVYGQGQRLLDAAELDRRGRILAILFTEFNLDHGLPKPVLARQTRELAVMLAAGQDIDRALGFMLAIAGRARERRILERLRSDIRAGNSLGGSLAEQPRIFSRLYVSLVRAGEAGGTLPASLARLADLLEREARLSASIRSALIYPALLVGAAVATVMLLVTQVLPQFVPIFADAGTQLPGPTRFLLGVGDVIQTDGGWILAALSALILLLSRILRDDEARKTAERMLLLLPIIGLLARRVQAARFVRTLGTLLGNGVGLVTALNIARSVLTNHLAMETIEGAASRVMAGGRLTTAVAKGRFFPPETIQLLHLGEEAGNLAEMSMRAADIHDEQVHQSIQRLVALLVPAITIVMGAVVAGIVGSLLVAMMSLNDLAQ